MEKELKNKNDLPFINLSKENMILLKDMFETDEIGNIMIAITNYVYFNIEPTQLTKKEIGGYNQLMSVIERKADGYFIRVNQGIENFKKINEKRKNEKQELSCYTPTQETEPDVTTDDEEKIREFFNNNRRYIENNYSEINASTINGNPKLGDFMGTNGFTAETMNRVYQEMKK